MAILCVFFKETNLMKTKSLLAWLALGVAVVLSGCSSSGEALADEFPAGFNIDTPATWLMPITIISSNASNLDAEDAATPHVITVRLTNAGPRAITTASGILNVVDASGGNSKASGNAVAFVGAGGAINVPARVGDRNGFQDVTFRMAANSAVRPNMVLVFGTIGGNPGSSAGGTAGTIAAGAKNSTAIARLNARSTWASVTAVTAP
jgi:hypothetical protein